MRRALGLRIAFLAGVLALVGLATTLTEAAPPAGQVPIDPTYVDAPYLLRTLELSTGGCRFIVEVARPRFQVQLHDSRFNPPTFLTYTVPDPNLGFFEDVLDGIPARPPAGSHWMVIGLQRSSDAGGGCSTADASFRRDWIIDWVRAAALTPTPTPSPTPSPTPTPPPTAEFTFKATAPNVVDFDGSPSQAVPPATITGYSWNFGSPPPSAEQKPTHVFPAPGVYDVTLTVTDSSGQTDPVTKQVRVLGEPVVNSIADTGLAAPTSRLCDTGGTIGDPPTPECTLRAAIQAVNNGGGSTIKFNIASGTPTISLLAALPEVSAPVFIDGRTQPGGWVTVNGGGSVANGLVLVGAGSELRGLALGGFTGTGVEVRGGSSRIAGNRIGTDVAGASLSPVQFAVVVSSGGNTIGGTTPADLNVIAGAGGGVHVIGATNNSIIGNRIGVNAGGTAVLGSGVGIGVLVLGGPTSSANGVSIERNTIAGFNRNVSIAGAETGGLRLIDNFIGTVPAGGPAPLENVRLDGSPQPTITGNTIVGARGANLVAAGRVEVDIVPGSTPGTVGLSYRTPGPSPTTGPVTGTGGTIAANHIGVSQSGVLGGPSGYGVLIWSDATTTAVTANRIGGHTLGEVEVYGGAGFTIAGNTIGLLGTRASTGVVLRGTSFATIGGTGNGNTIGDTTSGILLNNAPDTRIIGNRIGTDVTGTTAHPNSIGIAVLAAADVTIEGNQVSSSTGQGIISSGQGLEVFDNRIGTTADGTGPLPNGLAGIEIDDGTAAIGANVIAFNLGSGVEVSGGASAAVVSNSIFGNALIGIDNRANLPAAPEVAGVFRPASNGTTTRTWVLVNGLPTTGVGTVELFGNDDCTGAPQGRVVLSSLGALDAGRDYKLFTVLGRPELHGYTATFTGGSRTSDLSVCTSDTASTDTDADGVPDGIEALGPFGAGAATRQDQVAVPTDNAQFVGFQTAVGRFTSLKPVDTPSAPLPAGTSLPFGVVSFRIEGVAPGGTANVTVALPAGATANGYLKYGPQSAGGASGWYSFAFDAGTGTGVGAPLPAADFGDGVLRPAVGLTFVDGRRGDANFAVDGIIDDPGGVASVPATQPPTCANRTLSVQAGAISGVAPSCSDPDSQALAYSIVAQGTKGTASVVAGDLRYAANVGASGSDSFTYRASDGALNSVPATVTVTITSAPPTPTPTPSPTPTPTPGVRLVVEDAVVVLAGARDQLGEADGQRRLRDIGSRLGVRLPAEDARAGLVALGGRLSTPTGTRLRCGSDVTIQFGPMKETIEGGQFRNVLGQCLYIRPFRERERSGFSTVVLDLGRGRWAALGRTDSRLTADVLSRPVTVALSVGEIGGSTSIQLTRRGAIWVLRD